MRSAAKSVTGGLTGKLFVAGHRGLVGGACWRKVSGRPDLELVGRTHAELDLEDGASVEAFFEEERPDYVILAAAKVGGILANATYPAEFIRSNLAIQSNVIDAAYRWRVRKLLFLGSSCVYPKHARQPITEDALLTGPLEPTNAPYAIAKIAGIEMCRAYNRQFGTNFISVMPTNLYGPGDNFDLHDSHVLPALIRRFDDAKRDRLESVVLWGTGSPRREFLHVDDMADACVLLLERHDGSELVNIGCGEDLAIRDLAQLIKNVVGFEGRIEWDTSKPDGTPRKLLDISRLQSYGWRPKISLEDGIRATYEWYCANRVLADVL